MDTALRPRDLDHMLMPDHFDLGVRKRALLDDLGRAEPVAAVHDVDLGRIAREVVGLFDRGVSAPHHGQHLALEERSVTHRAVRHTLSGVLLLSRYAELHRSPAGSE